VLSVVQSEFMALYVIYNLLIGSGFIFETWNLGRLGRISYIK